MEGLYAATREANWHVVKEMLKVGRKSDIFNINSPVTYDGKTLLMVACEVGNLPMVKLLLDNGAKVDSTDESGQTPLHRACLMGLERRAPVELGPNYTVDNLGVIDLLLKNGAKVDPRDRFGRTPLMFAAMSFRTETLTLLIERGADVDATGNRRCGDAYDHACERARLDVLPCHCPGVNRPGHDAYDHACGRARLDVLPCHCPIVKKALATMKLLLSLSASSVDSTHFLLAVEHCTEKEVLGLLGRVDDPKKLVNSADYEGLTALMRAARANRQETVALLMDHGADVDALALKSGLTALQIATEHGSKQTIALIIKRGAAPR
jgi:ankyrin repeat protein